MLVTVKVIQPTKDIVNVQLYRKLSTELLNATGKEVKGEMLQPTTTWKTVKPTVLIQRTPGAVLIYTENAIWRYLDEGTSERWAVVSYDFESKTSPRSLAAGSGHGEVWLRGKRAMLAHGIPAQPGIEARGWLDIIEKRLKKDFPAAYKNILKQVT